MKWIASFKGPEDSPFENGIFNLKIGIPDDYPLMPPKVELLTPVYHPNIQTTATQVGAKICLDILEPHSGAWLPYMTLQKVVLCVMSLLAEPNPDNPLCPDIGKEMIRDKKRWAQKAKLWTYQHAQP